MRLIVFRVKWPLLVMPIDQIGFVYIYLILFLIICQELFRANCYRRDLMLCKIPKLTKLPISPDPP